MAVTDRPAANAEPAETLLAGAARATREARARLDHAVADLFLADAARLSERQRTIAARLLAKLVATIEDDLRQRLLAGLAADAPAEITASLAAGRLAIAAPILERSGLLRDADLVALLLRRSEEHRLVTGLHLATLAEAEAERTSEMGLLDSLLQAGDPELASAVMTLLIAESRRFDRFQDPMLARTDLPAELQHRLVWRVAAALRHYLVGQQALDAATADRALLAAANGLLASYDEGETLEGRAMTVARRLLRLGRLDDALIVRALREGRVALAVGGLALRAGIDFVGAWDMLADADGSRCAVLLRAIDMARPAAAEIVLRLALLDQAPGAEEGVAAAVEAFERLDGERAREAIRPWRLDAAYARAIDDLSAGLGGVQ